MANKPTPISDLSLAFKLLQIAETLLERSRFTVDTPGNNITTVMTDLDTVSVLLRLAKSVLDRKGIIV